MATYKDIYLYVLQHFNVKVGGNCIAEAKEKAGIKVRQSYNRINSTQRSTPCEDQYIDMIHSAMRHFDMLPEKKGDS